MSHDRTCWGGCGETIWSTNESAKFQHLESGECLAGWNKHHITLLAIEFFYHWSDLRLYERYHPSPQARLLPITQTIEESDDCYRTPEILMCPVCPTKSATLSGWFRHLETSQCPSSFTDRDKLTVFRLDELFRRNLARPEIQEALDETRYYILEPDRS